MKYNLNEICSVFHSSQEAEKIFTNLFHLWIHNIRDKLARELLRLSNHTGTNEFRKKYNHLDSIGKMRFLSTPEVSEFLEDPSAYTYISERQSNATVFDVMLAALHRESLISSIRNGIPISLTPTTNLRIDSPLGDIFAIYSEKSKSWKIQEQVKIGGLISIDFESELSKRFEPESGTFSQPRLYISQEEKGIIFSKLDRAISLVDKALPSFGLMIRTFTRRIIVRKTHNSSRLPNGKPLPLASEFRPVHSGCIRILNIHCDEMSTILCMEALVHETIHSYLTCYEDIYGKFMSTQIHVRPMSPWSGNLIPNHSMAHAVFVYFALFMTFKACLNNFHELTDAERMKVERRYCDVRAGFLIDRPLSSLFLLESPPADELFDIIDFLQKKVMESLQENIYSYSG